MKLESLGQLRVFTQIAESGSLSAAGRALGMPAITVGRRLAALEEDLGTTLVNRSTRSLSLSEAGRTLLHRARRILEEVEQAESALQRDGEGLAGVVRMSVPSVLTRDLLLALTSLMREHPGLRLLVRVHDRQVNPVAAGLDLVVTGGMLPDSTLMARKLADVTLVLAANRDYLQAHGTPTAVAELSEHRTLQFESDPPHTTWVLFGPKGKEHVVPVRGCLEVDDGRAMIDGLVAGLGIGLVSQRVLRATPQLVPVLPTLRGARFPVHAVYPPSGHKSARVRAVVKALRGALG